MSNRPRPSSASRVAEGGLTSRSLVMASSAVLKLVGSQTVFGDSEWLPGTQWLKDKPPRQKIPPTSSRSEAPDDRPCLAAVVDRRLGRDDRRLHRSAASG